MTKSKTKADALAWLSKYSAYLLLVVILLLNVIFTSNFFSLGTLWNIITQTCVAILTGMGLAMVISTGGIDISVGAVMALSGMVSAKLLPVVGLIPCILIALLAAAMSGLIAGFMIGKLNVQPMVVTLALMLGVRGVAQVINDAKIFNITGAGAEAYKAMGTAKLFGILPAQIIPIVIVVAAVWFVMEKTTLGLSIQAVGDNRRTARMAGIHSSRVLIFVYVASAVLAGVAGILATAKIGAADGNSLGLLAELDAIAAVAVGGTSMKGGKVKVLNTVIGALIMQLITITVNMNNINYEVANVLKAIILVVAVYIQREKTT